MESCLYEGIVHHERLTPVRHSFQYRLFMAYLDLDEVPGLLRNGLLSPARFAPASFLRRDHFGDERGSLTQNLRELIVRETGVFAQGPIRVLTHLRYFGYYFSPLNLFYCFAADGKTLQMVVAEVQNTPWLERHCYVFWEGNREMPPASCSYRVAKVFHVSPFMDMDIDYRWQLTPPEDRLRVRIENFDAQKVFIRATMQLQKKAMSRWALWQMQFRYPLMTARMTAAIYFQAFQLWRKKCRFYPHPKYSATRARPAQARPAQASKLLGLDSFKAS
jgi:DUF1365 family protein